MIVLGSAALSCITILTAGIGYTLLTYSKDGDLKHRSDTFNSRWSNPSLTSRGQAWERLTHLSNAPATEVTWNTSLFVAIVCSFMTLTLISFTKNAPLTSQSSWLLWLLSLLVTFFMQDLIVRWKSAHRRNPMASEQGGIIERLRWQEFSDTHVLTKDEAKKTDAP